MSQQEKEYKISEVQRHKDLHEQQTRLKKTDMRYILQQADKQTNQPKKKGKHIIADQGEREDILEVRRKKEEHDKKTQPQYKTNKYGITQLVEPDGTVVEDDEHEICFSKSVTGAQNGDSDDDPELQMLKQSNPNYKQSLGQKPNKKLQ